MIDYPEKCFSCGGNYRQEAVSYKLKAKNGKTVTIPDILVLICIKCGEETVPPDSGRKIEIFLKNEVHN